jgi:hypothetical protein
MIAIKDMFIILDNQNHYAQKQVHQLIVQNYNILLTYNNLKAIND